MKSRKHLLYYVCTWTVEGWNSEFLIWQSFKLLVFTCGWPKCCLCTIFHWNTDTFSALSDRASLALAYLESFMDLLATHEPIPRLSRRYKSSQCDHCFFCFERFWQKANRDSNWFPCAFSQDTLLQFQKSNNKSWWSNTLACKQLKIKKQSLGLESTVEG